MAEIKTVNQGWVKLNLPKKESNSKVRTKKPDWIRVKLPIGKKYTQLRSTVEKNNLHTICVSEIVLIWVNAGLKEQKHL